MSLVIDIYGTLVRLPEQQSSIENWGPENPKEQYWRRKELPEFFDEVEYDKDGVALLTPEQSAYAAIEVERCKKGFTFYNNGIATYITGKNYFYLQWWKLEDDIYPDYRDADRRYFLFLNYWENILWCIFLARGKKRREGASSQACSNLMYECIFYKSSNCGLVSKEEKDSRETFLEMVSFGYQQLPPFLKPRQLNRADSVTEFIFAGKAEKGENSGKKGNKSKINYRTPKENAYDRGRMSRVLGDEGGKWPTDIKFSKFISKVSKTLIKGAKRVGFMECPSTVNEMTKGGGAEYKKVWDGSNQFLSGGKKTPLRGVTYFTEAYDNYEGFIDKYGMSVIDSPDEETYNFLVEKWVKKDPNGETISEISEEDIKLGARVYVYSRRTGLTGDLLEEEIRQNPCTVQEMFEAANTDCAFNSYNINQRIKELEENPVFKREVLFFPSYDEFGKRTVRWRDITPNEKKFHWKITAFPPEGEENKFELIGKLRKPGRIKDGAIAIDSYSNSQGGRKYGSKASAMIGRKYNPLDPNNTGRAIGHLYGRPQVKDTLHEQVMLAAEYYGYLAYYEHTSDDYEGFFRERLMSLYLGIYPLSLIDPIKRNDAERHKGTPITPFSLSKQMDLGISYFEHHCGLIDFIEVLENAKIFDPYDRTSYDVMVCFLILIAVLTEPVYTPIPPKSPLIRTYGNTQSNKYKNPALADY